MTDRERAEVVRAVRFRQKRSACYAVAAAGLGLFVATGWPAAVVAAVGVLLFPHLQAAQRSGGRSWGMTTSYAGLRRWSLAFAQVADILILAAVTLAVANVVDGHRTELTLVAVGLVLAGTAIRRLGLWPTFR
jgi:hypothetical protein